MNFYSTKDKALFVSLKQAVLNSLPSDGGLYMPSAIPPLPQSFLSNLANLTFQEISLVVAHNIFGNELKNDQLASIISKSISFPAPLVKMDEVCFVLELFHGPSLAFKDFGARFMSQLMSVLNQDEDQELTILVATSGDTGGAVAAGFYEADGINVIILYPSGKVSQLQEKQLTTWDRNITAVEIDGSFDDCQMLVKQAFLDIDLNLSYRLSSANSINIARLIPQCFYYFEAYRQFLMQGGSKPLVFSVPSGNFGNLTAGLMAQHMGLKVQRFLAATNLNDSVPRFLKSNLFDPKQTIATISNAMDVGNPSNFQRMVDLFKANSSNCSTWNNMKNWVQGFAFDDKSTKEEIIRFFEKYQYILDPHSAVASLALSKYHEKNPTHAGIILETAHPSKFLDVINPLLDTNVRVPQRLSDLSQKKKNSVSLGKDFSVFKEWMINQRTD